MGVDDLAEALERVSKSIEAFGNAVAMKGHTMGAGKKVTRRLEDSLNLLIYGKEIETFDIPSDTSDKVYQVTRKAKTDWACPCLHFRYRRVECKHIQRAKYGLAQYAEVS